MNILNLIRYRNIIVTALTQLLIYYCVIVPTLGVFGLTSLIPGWVAICLFLGTLLITAGGYVINDYFDIKIDRINKPDKVIVGDIMPKQTAMRIYQGLTATGIALGLAGSMGLKSMTLVLIFILVPGMLWFYSASYKRQLIMGNLIVSLITALVPLLPLIAEAAALTNYWSRELIQQTIVLKTIYSYVCGFALFAFLLTFVREIIKDLQDQEGDRETECHTIPIVWGDTVAKITATAILLVVNILAAIAAFYLITDNSSITERYFLFGIALPSMCTIIILWSKSCTAYKNASSLLKFIMIIGILYTLIYNFTLTQIYGIPFLGLFQIIQPA